MRRWSVLAAGLGFGLFFGALSASQVALWAGIGISITGMVAYVASLPAGDDIPPDPLDAADEPDMQPGAARIARSRAARSRADDERRPTLSGLGTRIEQIMQLAEQQANDHLKDKRREADRIIAAAEKEARKIRAAADGDVWVVWRQDDNGNRYEVARVASRADADALAVTMESRGHKQTYWVAEA
jgi:vacuolar-type H+-ATPase subunit H